jgi:hypothetical protein
MLPTFPLIIFAALRWLTDPVALLVLLVLCLAVTFLLYAAWVPLVPDELSNPQIVAAGRARIAEERQRQQRG